MTRNQTFALDFGWNALLKDLGIHPERVLRRAGLPADLLARTGHGLTTQEYFRFWRSLEEEAGDPMFAVRIVETISAESFNPPLFAALCSDNLMQAVRRLATYKQLVAPMSLDVHVASDGVLTITPRWTLAQGEVPASLEIAELAFFVKLLRLATREQMSAHRVTLRTPPAPAMARRCTDFFGVAIERDAQPSISFTAENALHPFLTLNKAMWRAFEPDLRRRLSELDATATTAQRVRALLLDLLPSNAASIEVVADRLAMSKRTLQRRLDFEGENFRTLVNSTRESLARHYLANTAMSGGEIAFLLGFEDPNSFYRAFHEWTGQTPETVRYAARLN